MPPSEPPIPPAPPLPPGYNEFARSEDAEESAPAREPPVREEAPAAPDAVSEPGESSPAPDVPENPRDDPRWQAYLESREEAAIERMRESAARGGVSPPDVDDVNRRLQDDPHARSEFLLPSDDEKAEAALARYREMWAEREEPKGSSEAPEPSGNEPGVYGAEGQGQSLAQSFREEEEQARSQQVSAQDVRDAFARPEAYEPVASLLPPAADPWQQDILTELRQIRELLSGRGDITLG